MSTADLRKPFSTAFCVLRISRRHIFFSKSTCNNVFVPVDLNFVYPGKQKYYLWDPVVTSYNKCQILRHLLPVFLYFLLSKRT